MFKFLEMLFKKPVPPRHMVVLSRSPIEFESESDTMLSESLRTIDVQANKRLRKDQDLLPCPEGFPVGPKQGLSAGTTELNIGLDVGTTFTKVCYRNIQTDRVTLLPWTTSVDGEDAFTLPSVVFLDSHNRLYHPIDKRPQNARQLKCFKMEMLGTPYDTETREVLAARFPTLATPIFELLTAYYLIRTIRLVFLRIAWAERELYRRTNFGWSGNLGIPVDTHGSPVAAIYVRMVAIAYEAVATHAELPSTLPDFDTWYKSQNPDVENCPFSCVSELEATIIGLAKDKTTQDGYYPVFDIGGGTVDGSVVELKRVNGQPQLNFLTSHVRPLGMEFLNSEECDRTQLEAVFRRQVADVIYVAKQKTGISWARHRALPIYLCGGGRNESFYRKAILDCHSRLGWAKAGVPPLSLRQLDWDSDVTAANEGTKVQLTDQGRFLLAFGLSIDRGKYPDVIGFPMHNPALSLDPKASRLDFDEKNREIYGG